MKSSLLFYPLVSTLFCNTKNPWYINKTIDNSNISSKSVCEKCTCAKEVYEKCLNLKIYYKIEFKVKKFLTHVRGESKKWQCWTFVQHVFSMSMAYFRCTYIVLDSFSECDNGGSCLP